MHLESRAHRRRESASRRTNMDALPDELVERLFFFLRRDSDLQQLMAMHAVSRRLKRLLLAREPHVRERQPVKVAFKRLNASNAVSALVTAF